MLSTIIRRALVGRSARNPDPPQCPASRGVFAPLPADLGHISWIVFGALAGWVASMIAGTDREQGWLETIIGGMIGAFLGGFLFRLLTGRSTSFDWNIGRFIVAV